MSRVTGLVGLLVRFAGAATVIAECNLRCTTVRFRRFPVQDLTTRIVLAALDACQRCQLSYWDAAIIEAARAMGCTDVLSGDLSDSQDYGGVRVINPFR